MTRAQRDGLVVLALFALCVILLGAWGNERGRVKLLQHQLNTANDHCALLQSQVRELEHSLYVVQKAEAPNADR